MKKPSPSKRPKTAAPTPSPKPDTTGRVPEIVLLAVTGMSPAVLTETVWALSVENPPVIPDRVVVITTTVGRQALERELLSPVVSSGSAAPGGPDIWAQLRRAVLGTDAAHRLLLEPIRVITAPNRRTGRMDWLEDIRTPEENAAAAEFILDEVRRITANDDTRLIASLAGGRKTMSALVQAALSLLGRRHDRLTHVLVSEPFDQFGLQPRFYFPGQSSQPHRLATPPGGERVVDGSAALLQLADVPFVPLRYLFRDQLGRFAGGFLDLVATATELVGEMAGPVTIEFNRSPWTASFDGVPVELTGRDIPFFEFLYERAFNGHPPFANHLAAQEPFNGFLDAWMPRHPEVNLEYVGADWRKVKPRWDDYRKRLNSLRDRLRGAGLGRLVGQLLPPRGPVGFALDRVAFPLPGTAARAGQVANSEARKEGILRPGRQSVSGKALAPTTDTKQRDKTSGLAPGNRARGLRKELATRPQRVTKPGA
jgi:CRISPR-associated protein (TIGR02584 family)